MSTFAWTERLTTLRKTGRNKFTLVELETMFNVSKPNVSTTLKNLGVPSERGSDGRLWFVFDFNKLIGEEKQVMAQPTKDIAALTMQNAAAKMKELWNVSGRTEVHDDSDFAAKYQRGGITFRVYAEAETVPSWECVVRFDNCIALSCYCKPLSIKVE